MKPYDQFELKKEYEPIPLNELERKRLYSLAEKYASRRRIYKILLTMAASLLIIVSVLNPMVRVTAADIFDQMRISFSRAFRALSASDDYSYNIHEKIKLGELEFIVEDIVPMDDRIYFSMIFDRDHGILFENVFHQAYINGKKYEVDFWPISMEELIEDGRMTLTTQEITFDKPLPKKSFDLVLEFEDKKGNYAELHTKISQKKT